VEGARSVQLVGVDLLVRGSCREEEGSPSFELHLGELCIEQAPLDGQAAAPAGVQDLCCSSLQLADAPGDTPDGSDAAAASTQQLLSAQLAWQPPAGAVPRCCHVWCSFSVNGSGSSSSSSGRPGEPRWLGAACTNSYCIAGLPVPAGTTAVQFTVQPEGCNGRVQCLQEAAHMTAVLQPPGNS
jgi:hypothetical protein